MDFTTEEYIDSLPSGAGKDDTRYQPLNFTGSAEEYFRIWIVNILFTILTLGVYGAWAKVRTRRYFYANTFLDGQPFDYLAKPVAILKGHLIIVSMLILVFVANIYSEPFYFLALGLGLTILPFLLYKAHRFKAINSAYRNIRFGFLGDVPGAYKAYAYLAVFGVLLSLAAAVVLGADPSPRIPDEQQSGDTAGDPLLGLIFPLLFVVAYPYFAFLRRRYLHENLAYGKTTSLFDGQAKPFYRIYFGAIIAYFLVVIAIPPIGTKCAFLMSDLSKLL